MRRNVVIASACLFVIGLISVLGRDVEQTSLPNDARADAIVVDKSNHTMTLYFSGQVLRTYSVSLGRGGTGPKDHEGDNRTPEGRYQIDGRNPHSRFHLSLHINYPSIDNISAATAKGVKPGSDIMIHGIRNGLGWLGSFHRWMDWTAGCVALTDREIEEVWRIVPDGTLVEIRK